MNLIFKEQRVEHCSPAQGDRKQCKPAIGKSDFSSEAGYNTAADVSKSKIALQSYEKIDR